MNPAGTPGPEAPSAPLLREVRIGFTGSRRLYERQERPDAEQQRIDGEIERALRAELIGLRAELGLGGAVRLIGVSQIAIGADFMFARCCGQDAGTGIDRQLIVLPEPVAAYLAAAGKTGPDFSGADRAVAERLLQRPAVADIRCVSDAPDRSTRFEDTLRAILGLSDVGVCLLRADATSQRGGSLQFLELARRAGKPVRVIEVRLVRETVRCEARWQDRQRWRG